MSTSWVRELLELNFFALADVVLDIQQESQLVGPSLRILLYQQVVKFPALLPDRNSGTIDRACDLRWKAIKLLESHDAIINVTAYAGAHRWETTIAVTLKPEFNAISDAVHRELEHRTDTTAPHHPAALVLAPPQKVTLPWLVRHVSVQLWISAIIFLGTTFMLGVRASEYSFFRWIGGLKPLNENAISGRRLQRPPRNALVLPRSAQIYLQVRVGDSTTTPAAVNEWLDGLGYTVHAIRMVDPDKSPSVVSEVRFFHEADRRGAESLVQALRDWGYEPVDRRYAPGFEKRVARGQFEVWFVHPKIQP